jgi:hypothetical protein
VSGWKQQGWPSNSAQAFLLLLQEIEAFGNGISRAQCSKECCTYNTLLLSVIFGQLAGICHQLSATAGLITKHGPKDVNHHSKEHQYSRSTYLMSCGRSRKKREFICDERLGRIRLLAKSGGEAGGPLCSASIIRGKNVSSYPTELAPTLGFRKTRPTSCGASYQDVMANDNTY